MPGFRITSVMEHGLGSKRSNVSESIISLPLLTLDFGRGNIELSHERRHLDTWSFIGDVVEDADGVRHMVASFGFDAVRELNMEIA